MRVRDRKRETVSYLEINDQLEFYIETFITYMGHDLMTVEETFNPWDKNLGFSPEIVQKAIDWFQKTD